MVLKENNSVKLSDFLDNTFKNINNMTKTKILKKLNKAIKCIKGENDVILCEKLIEFLIQKEKTEEIEDMFDAELLLKSKFMLNNLSLGPSGHVGHAQNDNQIVASKYFECYFDYLKEKVIQQEKTKQAIELTKQKTIQRETIQLLLEKNINIENIIDKLI
jgi:hypothetical protein